jgi:methyl-accepting chemotaxis protein
MAEIASSSREQASGIEQVNKAIMMMDDMTQQNAALVEQAAAAAQPAPVGAAARAVERRSPTRPLTGKTRPQAVAAKTFAIPRATAAAEEQWKDF